MAVKDQDKWNQKYQAGSHTSREVSPALLDLAEMFPRVGKALDVAGGAGRNSLWMAQRGLSVTLIDVSNVALEIAENRAAELQLALTVERSDLEVDGLPKGPWDVILFHDFLYRPLFKQVSQQLSPDGMLVVVHPTVKNLERHTTPSSRFLLKSDELPSLLAGLEIVQSGEAWRADGRHVAVAVARSTQSVV